MNLSESFEYNNQNKKEQQIENPEEMLKTEILELRETRFQKAKKVTRLAGLGFIFASTFLSSCKDIASQSQEEVDNIETPYSPINFDKFGYPNNEGVINNKEYIESAKDQYFWLINYINSPKYTERLEKELAMENLYHVDKKEVILDNIAGYITIDYENSVAVNSVGKIIGGTEFFIHKRKEHPRSGYNYDLESRYSLKNFDYRISLEKRYGNVDVGNINGMAVGDILETRKKNLEGQNYHFVEQIGLDENDFEGVYFNKHDDSGHDIKKDLSDLHASSLSRVNLGAVLLQKNPRKIFKTAPIHEFSHQSTDANYLLPDDVKKIIEQGIHPQYRGEYLGSPTEVKARIDAFRYLLHKYNIYDANLEDFSEEHLKKLLEHPEIYNSDSNINDLLFELFPDEWQENLIWLMNNIASVDLERKNDDFGNQYA